MYFLLAFLLLGARSCSNKHGPGLSFALIKPRYPALGLFPSAVVHAAILIFSLYPSLSNSLNPPRIIERRWEYLRPTPRDSFVMTNLSYSAKLTSVPAQADSHPARKSPGTSSS